MRAFTHASVYINLCSCVCVCVYMDMCVCVCVCVCIYIYIYINVYILYSAVVPLLAGILQRVTVVRSPTRHRQFPDISHFLDLHHRYRGSETGK